MTRTVSLAAAAALAAFALAPAALAQDAAAPAAPAASASAYTDEQLKKFADALTRVKAVNDEYGPKLAAATGEAATTVRQEMGAKLYEALQAAGVPAEQYNKIAADVQKDPALGQRVAQLMQPAETPAAN